MSEAGAKKGMSKGCLIGLIIAAVIVIIIIVGIFVMWNKKDDIMKYGVVTTIASAKTDLRNSATPVLDTLEFFPMADEFLERFKADSLRLEDGMILFEAIRTYAENKVLDSNSADMLVEGMIAYYPDLGDMVPFEEEAVDTTMADSL